MTAGLGPIAIDSERAQVPPLSGGQSSFLSEFALGRHESCFAFLQIARRQTEVNSPWAVLVTPQTQYPITTVQSHDFNVVPLANLKVFFNYPSVRKAYCLTGNFQPRRRAQKHLAIQHLPWSQTGAG